MEEVGRRLEGLERAADRRLARLRARAARSEAGELGALEWRLRRADEQSRAAGRPGEHCEETRRVWLSAVDAHRSEARALSGEAESLEAELFSLRKQRQSLADQLTRARREAESFDRFEALRTGRD